MIYQINEESVYLKAGMCDGFKNLKCILIVDKAGGKYKRRTCQRLTAS